MLITEAAAGLTSEAGVNLLAENETPVAISVSPSTIAQGVPTTVTITYTGIVPAAGSPVTADRGTVGSETVGASTVTFTFTDATAETVIFTDTASGATCTVSVVDATPPDPATGLFASYDSGTGTATFTWTASDSPDVAGYYVYEKRDAGVESPFATPGGTPILGTTFATALAANHVYVCRVQALDGSGNASFSSTITIDTHPGVSYGSGGHKSPRRFTQVRGLPRQLR